LSAAAVRCALFIPLFDELAEPSVAIDIALVAEAAGWDGVFVWDHMLYRSPVERIADPWTVMAAMAQATERIALGPMVTPIARRRPQVLARQAATLDRLSNGRLIFGAGLGGDPGGELSRFDEEMDARVRAKLLDDGLEQIDRWWRGEEANDVQLLPTPVQHPRIPIWVASRSPNRAPIRRAARWDGWFPIGLTSPDDLVVEIAYAQQHRSPDAGPWDIAVQGLHDEDPAPWSAAGATWWLVRFEPFDLPASHVRDVAEAGPPIR
jgi:alkanesulfonate monooxygenase SsuD/methylene tetrahydromethanopterin reductase-like flavin-dependent oxidoreductase (luciferase family)